jgi:hypothetical protein
MNASDFVELAAFGLIGGGIASAVLAWFLG